ncbi:MAG: hypothetical protein QXD48_01780 [Candidatus Aenigmatarchaeota archaeon]
MPIVGFNLNSINAKNEEKIVKGEINISSTPIIKNVEKKDLDLIKDVISIQFGFKTIYEPKIGEINFEGEILYQTEDIKKILKVWKDEKKLDDKIAVDVLNTIFRRCLTKAAEISDELRLPPPIRFPVVQPKSEGN